MSAKGLWPAVLFCLCFLLSDGIFRRKRSVHEGEEKGNGGKGHHEDHSELIDSLLEHYDSSCTPTHVKGGPTFISVNLQLISLDDISDSKMEVVLDLRMIFLWSDPRLSSPECRDEGIECDDSFDLKKWAGRVWLPDLYILNSRLARQHEQPFANGMLTLVADGGIVLSKRLTLTLRCPMDLQYYPLDSQQCPLLICPYSLPEEELVLRWTEQGIGILDFAEDGQKTFRLQKPILTGHTNIDYHGPDVSGRFSCANATLTLRRRNGYHMGYSYSLTSLIVAVSWLGFWLPAAAAPARITLGVTTLLTMLTTANFVRRQLPPISYLTALDVWVGACTAFVFLTLLLFPFAHWKSTQKINLIPDQCLQCGNKSRIVPPTPRPKKGGMLNVDLDGKCRFLFPAFFVIFNIAYWSYYLS